MNRKTPDLEYRDVTFDELEFHVRRGRQLQREAVADFLRSAGAGVAAAFRGVGALARKAAPSRPHAAVERDRHRHA